MVANVGTLGGEKAARRLLRRVVHSAGSMVSVVRSAWLDLGQSGQLGPSQETLIGRHTGARI